MERSRIAVVVGSLTLAAGMSVLPLESSSAQTPSTSVVIPSNNATVSGTSQVLDASASSGVTQVEYEITGGALTDSVVATATPTIYGWLALWNTTTVPNGTYDLQSVATANGVSLKSALATIIVTNAPPSTTVVIPASGATLDTSRPLVFDAAASPGVTKVSFSVNAVGSAQTLTATPTIYGWIAVTTGSDPACPADCESLTEPVSVQSTASYSSGLSGTSPIVTAIFEVWFQDP